MYLSTRFYRKKDLNLSRKISILGMYECENGTNCEGWVYDNVNYPALEFYGFWQFINIYLSDEYQKTLEYRSEKSNFLFMNLVHENKVFYKVEDTFMKVFFEPKYILPSMEKMYFLYEDLFSFVNTIDEDNEKEVLHLFIQQLKRAIDDDLVVYINIPD
ncbi:hypothetical protein VB264_23220 [Arcicella aquatica]|uniref:Immunity protein 42 of polymorphic toxin system n=1 Tax=Arcicella aquatica TaxID=217141 RepID=A0ABU5QV89_9BACT|nr:hypothetical protein [Arcicella aquatica]MEA5260729.1 hypothetical protein [Arcicella aquatica]